MCNDGPIHVNSPIDRHHTFRSRQAALLLALSVIVFGQFSMGQSVENPAPAPQPHHAKKQTLDDQVQKLAKPLDLNETQQSEVKRILERQQESIRRLRDQGSPAGTDWVSRV